MKSALGTKALAWAHNLLSPETQQRMPGIPRPACGERATRQCGKPELGSVRGRFDALRLAEVPPHPDLLPARGEKEPEAVRP